MAFTDRQAAAKAKQIFDRFGQLIHDACVGTGVKEGFLAGFTGVEAGIDRQGKIDPDAKRFEPGVYHHLISVRDGLLSSYDHVTHRDLAGMTDDAIRNLSTSWGCTQIMGWHMIHDLAGTIDDLRDLDKHFGYTVQLLKIVGGHYMRDGDLASVLRIWNTGNANGKTYHEDYVTNALKVKKFYDELIADQPFAATVSAAAPAVAPSETQSDLTPSADDPVPSPPEIVLPPTPPEADDQTIISVPPVVTEKDDSIVSKFKTWYAALPAFLTAAFGGFISWLQGAATEIIVAFFATAGVVATVFIVTNFLSRRGDKQREFEATEKQKDRDFELTKLQLQSAMDKTKQTVRVAPPAVELPSADAGTSAGA